MRVDWCVSSWFRIKNTHSLTHTRRTMWAEGGLMSRVTVPVPVCC